MKTTQIAFCSLKSCKDLTRIKQRKTRPIVYFLQLKMYVIYFHILSILLIYNTLNNYSVYMVKY